MPASPELEAKVNALPDEPGVYLWKDAKGNVLYVGKAKRLRSRVRNYLSKSYDRSPKNLMLISLIADVETIVVPSEAQALVLENNLIKENSPRFNISFRDDKSYPSIAVTMHEPFPRVLVVRRTNIKGARYFGPYTDVTVLRRTLKIIRRLFQVRSCSWNLPNDTPERPCLDYHIKRCQAPCVDYQSQEDYRAMIGDVMSFLEGKTVDVRSMLRQRMEEASGKLEYERAAEIRNSLRWLDQLERPSGVEIVGAGDADAIGFARDDDDAVCVLLRIRGGKVVGRDHRFLNNLEESDDADVLSAFMVRHYLKSEQRATRLLLPFPPSDTEELDELLNNTMTVPMRGKLKTLVDLADQNARHLMESFQIESFVSDERVEDPVYALGRDLGLTFVPRSMVCIDISTNQGKDTVGSLVWFEGGRPRKSEYRRFKIKGEKQQDDFAAIEEVVTRYLTRRRDEEKDFPDLIFIDGGKGQLGAAIKAAAETGVEVPLASIAKKEEEIFLPGNPRPVRLSRSAASLQLVQRIRDEAHRFAVEYNRKRRKQRTFESELLNVPGVGPNKRRDLLERFGSLAGVKLASIEELTSVPGISNKLAQRIMDHVKGS